MDKCLIIHNPKSGKAISKKILEEYNRPVFLFTREGDILKGSGRSITDINIHNILTNVSDILEVELQAAAFV